MTYLFELLIQSKSKLFSIDLILMLFKEIMSQFSAEGPLNIVHLLIYAIAMTSSFMYLILTRCKVIKRGFYCPQSVSCYWTFSTPNHKLNLKKNCGHRRRIRRRSLLLFGYYVISRHIFFIFT